ncbi:MAG: NTP transferase domain-containing protein [Bradymonadia bacterium]
MSGEVWGLLLAGGASRRMGRAKGLIPYGQGTFASHLVEMLRTGGCADVVVVVGAYAEAYGRHLAEAAHVVRARDWPMGMRASLQHGVRAVPVGASVVLTHVDRPALRSSTVAALIEKGAEAQRPVLPVWQGRSGHPVYLPGALVDQLRSSEGPVHRLTPLREVLRPLGPVTLPITDPGVLLNVNTPLAAGRLLRHPGAQGRLPS